MKPQIKIAKTVPSGKSVVCILSGELIPAWLKLTKSESEYVTERLSQKDDYIIINQYGRVIYIIAVKTDIPHHRVKEELRRTAYNLRKTIKENNHSELVIASEASYKGAVEDFAEGFILSIYSFDKYKTKDVKNQKCNYPSTLLLYGELDESSVEWLNVTTDAVYFTRTLIREPVNHLNATTLAGEIKKLGEESGFTVEVLTKGKVVALKMGGLLAVNQGSVDPPVFSILEWKPADAVNKNPIVLVGKGIVYDTGGLNIKTGEFMAGMNGDMAGAAIVSGVMYVAAKTKIPLHLIALVPSTDNRPGGNAYTQGDIITMFNKMTVEIGNTDAEGRLILADAISYASRYKPELIIDIATLTGSAAMTFSNQAIAVMSNADRKYTDLLSQSGNEVYERTAELPLWDEYGELIKSEVADMKNVGGREAGAIIAGKFLERFAEYPLIHLDIAGTEIMKKDDYYKLKNGPATGLRLLSTFLRSYARRNSDLK